MRDGVQVKRDFIRAAMRRAVDGNYPIVEPRPEDNDRDFEWWIRVFDAKSFLFSENGSASWLFPHYQLKLQPLDRRVVVRAGGETIVDSRKCFEFRETAHPVQIYIPRSEMDLSRLSPSETLTYCPFKSIAKHYSLFVNGRTIPDAFWSYEQVYEKLPSTGNADGILAIKGMLSPYRDKVDVEVLNS